VTDTRRSMSGGVLGGPRTWSTKVVASDLISTTDTLTASTFSYASGTNTPTGGFVLVTSVGQSSLSSAVEVEHAASATGNHVVTWSPTVSVPVPAFQKAGSYSGTITHSVL
jgi:hypothetical protein